MLISRVKTSLFALPLFASVMLLTACPQGDVGAPCNHGSVEAPSSKLVTFPALSCSDLLCVYGEEQTVPEITCETSQQCNDAANTGGENIFECVTGACRLSLDYVLARSMCSKTCESDDDCNNTSLNNRPAVDDDETACRTGFSCTVLQQLGQFCCERLCVCNDDLDSLDNLEMDCEPNVGQSWIDCYGEDDNVGTTSTSG
ncbi:MAG: hypothetical protein HC927_00620 [Deltaproteobacteria bacterium]|nr:hypothetical protein [Deltaproteobacteria bacterium]